MPESSPASEPSEIGSDYRSLHNLGEAVAAERESRTEREDVPPQERPVEEIGYHTPDGYRYDPHYTVSAKRAAEDLAAMRESKIQSEEEKQRQRDAEIVDAIRQGRDPSPQASQAQQYNQQTQQQPYQQTGQPYYQQSEPPAWGDPNRQAPQYSNYDSSAPFFHQNGQVDVERVRTGAADLQKIQAELKQGLQAANNEIALRVSQGRDYSDVTAHRQQLSDTLQRADYLARVNANMAHGASDRAAFALAEPEVVGLTERWLHHTQAQISDSLAVLTQQSQEGVRQLQAQFGAFFPEIQGIAVQDLPRVMQGIQRANPQRYRQIAAGMQYVSNAIARDQELFRQKMVSDYRVFQTWCGDEDKKLVEEFPEFAPGTDSAYRLNHQLAKWVCEEYGMTKDELYREWNTNHKLRDHRSQSILYRAYKYSQLQEARQAKKVKPSPTRYAARPGSSESGIGRETGTPLPSTFKSAKDAAAYLQNRRRGG
jgi:hypothetical protein